MTTPTPTPVHVPTRDGYDQWAALYDADDNPLVKLEEPVVESLLGNVAGFNVLDLGCGTGRHTIRLSRAGAIVTAADFSEGMLGIAQSKSPVNTRFVVCDLHERLPFDNGEFDRILCCLVLDHIADLAHVFSEMRRVCRMGGFILATAIHPTMELAGVRARFTDPATGQKVYPASVCNRVSDYVNCAAAAGLTFAGMSEHVVDDVLIARSNNAEKYRGWPLLLTMTLRPSTQQP